MVCVRPICPRTYEKCNQTVTVYHQNADKTITRTVYDKAFLDFRKNQNVNKTGSTETNSFLLVIPRASITYGTFQYGGGYYGGDYIIATPTLYAGDKAYLGTGPVTITWADFIPVKVPGLVVIKYVDPKYWNGRHCHVEAGG